MQNEITNLLTKLKTPELVEFAQTAPDEIMQNVLDELEGRMNSEDFINLCHIL